MEFQILKRKMSYFKYRCFSLFLIILAFSLPLSMQQETKKISSVNMLLPICKGDCNKVYGSNSAEGGCFTWTTDRQDVISLKELQKKSDPEGCKSKVFISPITKSANDYAFLTARELKTNEYFKCKVGFAELKSINIEKQFDRLYVGEDFELQVQAHDSRSNLFSSLEGWKFNWKIVEGAEYAEIQKLKDHGKKRYGKGRKFAEETAYSDLIIVKGISAGKVVIEVEILEDELKGKIKPDRKTLYIVEPFQIYPQGPLYFLKDTKFDFDIYLTNSKRFIRDDERKYYSWKVLDETCSIIDANYGKYQSLQRVCTTRVVANDKRLEYYNEDSVEVNVVIPNSLEFLHKPISEKEKNDFYNLKKFKYNDFIQTSFWKLVEEKHYLIQNFLMYNGNPVIFNTEKINFKINLRSIQNYIEKGKEQCKNTCNEICQISTIKWTLEENQIESSIRLSDSGTFLHASNKVVIYPKIKIEKFGMPYFTLPLLDNSKSYKGAVNQELYLRISGGSGIYNIETSNPNVISVFENTYVYANSEIGESLITAVDKEIRENNDTVLIKTKYINAITYMEERQEILVNNLFDVTPIAYHDISLKNEYDVLNIFTNCSRLSFGYDVNLKDIVQDLTNEHMNIDLKLKNFILKNKETTIKRKIEFNKKGIRTQDHEDYLDYSNYGICSINTFKGLNEGLVKINYNTLSNSDTKSSLNPAQIYLYFPLEHIPIITDEFTNKLIEKGNIGHPDKEKLFIISKGLSLNLNFKGGVVPWADYKKDYSEVVYTFDKYSNEIAVSNIYKYLGTKTYDIKKLIMNCYKNDFERLMSYTISNKADATLLNPAVNKFIFKIGCEEPKHLSMFILSQQDNFAIPMYNMPQLKGLKYYEEKNFADILRVYAFDDNKRILCNISLLAGNWKVYKEDNPREDTRNYYEILAPKNYEKYNVTDVKYSNEFIQDVFLFKNYLSTFNIMYSLKKDITSHYLTIELIGLPKLVPDEASIYIKNKNPFVIDIVGGSGNFKVSSNNQYLATVNYNQGSRKIYLYPNAKGIVVVDLVDNYMNRYTIQGKYNLVDLQELRIQESDMIMVNKTGSIFIKAIDTSGNEMTTEQLQQVPLVIENYKGADEIFLKFNENKTHILATGLLAGNYQINIRDKNSNIESNYCQIEVFNALEIFPPYLLLVPGSSYTLSVKGGPAKKELVQLKYVIDNKQIAEVESENYPLVKGKLIGETILRVTLSYKYKDPKFYINQEDKTLLNRTDVLCVEEVPIEVAFPEKAGIIYADGNRQVYTGATIRLFSALKKGDKVFTYGTGPFKFQWNVDLPRIAKMLYYMKSIETDADTMFCDSLDKDKCNTLINTEEDKDPSSSIGVFLKTINEGIVTISLKILIDYPEPYKKNRNQPLDCSSKIIIKDEIFFNIPEFYGTNPKTSGIYLIPLDVEHELSTNKKKSYSYKINKQIDKESPSNPSPKIISLSDSGRVTSYLKSGLVYVGITPKDIHENMNNNIPVILSIFVTEFNSIFIERTDQLVEIEIGQEIQLKVVIQHESGLLFAEKYDRMKLRVIESHPKVATSELIESNSKLKIKSHTLGTTNIILFHPITRRIYDVFRISVNKDISHMGRIVINVGGTINFLEKNPELKKQMAKNSYWESENSDIVSIDRYSGKAKALSEGTTVVNLKTSDGKKIKLSIKVVVKKIYTAKLDRTNAPSSLTDIKSNENYRSNFKLPIELLTDTGEKFTNNANDTLNQIDHNLKVKCRSENTEIVVAGEELANGYECSLTIRDAKFKSNAAKPKDIKVNVNVETLSPFNKKYRSVKEFSEKFPFSSSFKIKNNIKEVNLTYANREYILHIDNLNDLNFTLSDQNLFSIEKQYAQNSIKIKVPNKVINDFVGERLTITNVLSGQQEEITVNFRRSQGAEYIFGIIHIDTFTDFLTVTFLFLIAVIIFYASKVSRGGNYPRANNYNYNYGNSYQYPGGQYPGQYSGQYRRSAIDFDKAQ